MPWEIREGHAECKDGYAVVKSDTGAFVACHKTKAEAEKHVAALYVNVPEARSVAFLDIDANADGSEFRGYAAVFDSELTLGEYSESVARGAFRKVLAAGQNVPMLFHHNDQLPVLATTKAGTLKLSEDGKGLRVEARIGNHFIAEAVKEMVSRDEIDGMSYGFVVGSRENQKLERRDGKVHRTLTGFSRLLDVSPTWDPAYPGTSAELRAMASMAVPLQQLLEGEAQQLEEGATGTDEPTPVEESAESRAAEQRTLSVAARKRALQFLILNTGGIDDETR